MAQKYDTDIIEVNNPDVIQKFALVVLTGLLLSLISSH
jgi:hypothetical protein